MFMGPEFSSAATSRLHLIHQERTAMLWRQMEKAGDMSIHFKNKNTSPSEIMNTSQLHVTSLLPPPSLLQISPPQPQTNAAIFIVH